MLTTEEFRDWCQRLHLSQETEQFITALRSLPPVRKVRGRASNVTGRYPSPKMQVSIQFESHHVELWAIYAMERDDDVLEYYDQPSRIPLQYRAKSGRKTTQWHTPDFFVLRQESAGWEEWKAAQSLDGLGESQPARYQRDATGQWICPPGETYAASLGLSYRVRSSAEYRPLFIQNVKFLQDFWAHPVSVTDEQEAQVQTLVTASPGLSVADVLEASPTLSLDVIWVLLATRRLFTDLAATSLMHHDRVPLYRSEAEATRVPASPPLVSSHDSSFPALVWDGRVWFVESMGEHITLRPEVGESLTLPPARFHSLMQDGLLRVVTATDPSPTTPEIRHALLHASPKTQKVANQRLEQLLLYVHGEALTTPARTVQRWLGAYHAAEEQYGCGYIGLLDHVADRGNRTQRISDDSLHLLETFLKEHYATPQAKRAAAVYRLYREACEQQHIPAVSQRTFYRVRERKATPDVTAVRLGRRAAYTEQPFFILA